MNFQDIMKLRVITILSVLCLMGVTAPQVYAQNSAPSSHFVFDDNFDGDILINEVRVPKDGEATFTYYEALGWRGKGAGYAGIQAHPKAHLFIFSIWDHPEHAAPIKAVYRGPGTETVGFGGEGTGLKSWNFDLGCNTDVWYTLVARSWPVGDHTYYGFWTRAGDTGKWTHLVTMDVAAKANFQGGTDAFIEDWASSGAKPRTTHLRGGWKRKTDGSWFPFRSGRYSVNSWDLDPGKRSYNYRTHWNGGVQRDETGEYYFMLSGGANSVATTANPSKFTIERKDTAPTWETIRIRDVNLALADAKKLSVTWELDDTTTPQFAYAAKLFDNTSGLGRMLAEHSNNVPHARSATLDLSSLDLTDGSYYVLLQCTDILGRQSETVIRKLAADASGAPGSK
jgi:hypothetical protein